MTDTVAGGLQGVLEDDEPPPPGTTHESITLAAQGDTGNGAMKFMVETTDTPTLESEPVAVQADAAARVEDAATPPKHARPAEEDSPGTTVRAEQDDPDDVNTHGGVKSSTDNDDSSKSSDDSDENSWE